jgi:ATP-dependent RNA helicase DeaD
LEALSRIIEVEKPQGVLIFVKTKSATTEVAEALSARGFNAAAINGDLPQPARETLISKLKVGTLQVLVATDVAARGLDVDRIELVVNFELPSNVESYVHRIGRTGRAGRSGRAILFLSPRERRFLRVLEQAGKGAVKELTLPSKLEVQAARVNRFKDEIRTFLAAGRPLGGLEKIIDEVAEECNVTPSTVAAVLCARARLIPAFEAKETEREYDREGDFPTGSSKRRAARSNNSDREGRGRQRSQARFDHREEKGSEVRIGRIKSSGKGLGGKEDLPSGPRRSSFKKEAGFKKDSGRAKASNKTRPYQKSSSSSKRK